MCTFFDVVNTIMGVGREGPRPPGFWNFIFCY